MQNFAEKCNSQLDTVDIKLLNAVLININLDDGYDSFYTACANFAADYLNQHRLLNNYEYALNTALNVIILVVCQTFNINFNISE